MKIGIPVKCQNGHKAIWIVEISGLDIIHRGVHPSDKCTCPKHEIGEGYFADGRPFLSNADAASDVLAERQRQVQDEGWTPEHDDQHDGGDLAAAASSYALYAADGLHPMSQGDGQFADSPPTMWPFSRRWWKPKDHRQALVKAGALILAEIERIDRKDGKKVTP